MKLQRLEFLDIIGLLGGTHFQLVEGLLASLLQKLHRIRHSKKTGQISLVEESRARGG
jgi:hypothetical protein